MKKISFWIFQILPPMCIFPLCWIRQDIFADFFWLPAYVGMLVSFYTLPARFIKSKLSKDCTIVRELRRKTIRPLLTIFMTLFATHAVHRSFQVAIQQAAIEAQTIQKLCDGIGGCPSKIDGWEDYWKDGRPSKDLGAQVKYRATYATNNEHTEYAIYLRRDIDYRYVITGGKGKQIEHRP